MTRGGRLPSRDDDRGSLAMAMLAILVGAMLGALIVPMVLSQNDSTRFDMSRVRSLHAAQTGVDVMLGQIRASSRDEDGVVTGNPRTLPCHPEATPLDGNPNGTGAVGYSVSVVYWAAPPAAGGRPMLCSPIGGTFDPVAKTATPRYAVITSTGTDRTGGARRARTIVSTYVFRTSDTNIPGGQIRLFPLAGADSTGPAVKWCMQADDPDPDVGTKMVLRACSGSTPPLAQQVFAYRMDLSIQLVSSVGPGHLSGLCIDTEDPVHAVGVGIVLKACGVAKPEECPAPAGCSPYNQQWSVDDSAHLRGAREDKSTTDDYCINAPAQSDGAPLSLQTCRGGTADPFQTWVPSPTTGAGMAGPKVHQLVNYRQFATCLDVTGQDPDSAYLIFYTCKQNPNPTQVLWNQRFTPDPPLSAAPTTVLLKTTRGTTYCLMSPLEAGGYVRVSACPAGTPTGSAFSWKMYQTQDDAGNDLPYAWKYTIVDSTGRLCLGPGRTDDLYNSQYIKAVVNRCDGTTDQKWNATASLDASRMTNTHEAPPSTP